MKILVNGEAFDVEVLKQNRSELRFLVNGREYEVSFAESVPSAEKDTSKKLPTTAAITQQSTPVEEDGSVLVRAPMPGVVTEIQISAGQKVKSGQALVQIEAMKMQNAIFSPCSGSITDIYVETGVEVGDEQPLVRIQSS